MEKKRSRTLEELINFMAKNGILPVVDKRGRIYLRCKRKLKEEEKKEILDILKIKGKDDCIRIRKKIKAAAEGKRPIKEWIEDERPRELLIKKGPESLPTSKLLAIILRTGKEGISAEELAKRILNRFGSLRNIDSADISEICKIEGIGIAKACQIKAAFELGKRLIKEKAEKRIRIKTPSDLISYVMEYYGPYLRDAKKEFFCVVFLDTKNHPICNMEISRGTANASLVDPKEIIREAIFKSATSIILVHNHPSGDPTPSKEDIFLTERIKEACSFMNIKVLDHIIIGKNISDYFSFKANDLV